MKRLSLAQMRAHFSEIADEVHRTHERVHITRNGRDDVVLVASRDIESLEATIELLRDKDAMARISDADAAVARGEITSAEDMALPMARRRHAAGD